MPRVRHSTRWSRPCAEVTYASMYGMKRTTVYLPEALKASLERIAAAERRSEAELIREALSEALERRTPPRPQIPLLETGFGDPTVAERVDDFLNEGFGGR